jgi:hypothetical protein
MKCAMKIIKQNKKCWLPKETTIQLLGEVRLP